MSDEYCAGAVLYDAIADVRDKIPSLRDYFAAHSLAGYIATYAGPDCGTPSPERAAKLAYEYADAMLKAREEKP